MADVRIAAQDAVAHAVRTGRFDRDLLVTSLAHQTKLSRADAAVVAGRIQQQFYDDAARVKLEAQQAAESTGHAFWGVFAALLAGLLASMGGALLAVSREQRDRAETVIGVAVHPRSEPLVMR